MDAQHPTRPSSVATREAVSWTQLAAAWKAALSQLLFGTETSAIGPLADRSSEARPAPHDAPAATLPLLCALYGSAWPEGTLPAPVQLRRAPCYTTVVPPLLLVLDLDHTVLRCPLSGLGTSAEWTTSTVRDFFVDVDFLHNLCDLLWRKGHHLAIASFTEGMDTTANLLSSADDDGLTPAQSVVRLLDCTLPLTRSYLTEPHQIVCMPASGTSRKLPHLRRLQQCLSRQRPTLGRTADTSPSPTRPPSVRREPSWASCDSAESDADPGTSTTTWVSTEVVLIDDNPENCWAAAANGYNAFCCADGGLTYTWLVRNRTLTQLLGLTLDEVYRTRGVKKDLTDDGAR